MKSAKLPAPKKIKIMRNVKDGTSILVMPEVKKVNEVYQNTSKEKTL